MTDSSKEAGAAQDKVREYLKRLLLERGNPLYTFSQASHDIIKCMIDDGWKSPSDVESACVAAQRDAFERAENVACEHASELWDGNDIARLIRTLSPSPGPFKRVPEGWTVARLKPTAEMIEAGVDAHYPGDEVVYPDEWETPDQAVIASYRAMIAAGGKP